MLPSLIRALVQGRSPVGGNLTVVAGSLSRSLRLEGDQVTSMPWDAQGEAQAALRAIVADSRYGPAALSNAQTMTNLLKDMLPDAPRESSVLVAASEAGLAGMLRSSLSQGMDVATACRLASGTFESRTALTPDACNWAVGILASALGLDAVRAAPPPQPAFPPPPPPAYDNRRPPVGYQPTVAPGPTPGPGPGPAWVTPPAQFRPRSGGPDRLTRTAAAMTAVAAILIVWACALPDLYTSGSSGRTSFSIFNSGGGGDLWFAVEPVGVAVIGVLAGVVIMAVNRSARLRLLAAGVLFGFGIQTVLLFAGYE